MKMESSCNLLIRHLPDSLNDDKKIDLLKHFGAVNVAVMGIHGAMKHSAFASFASTEAAKHALSRLHQLEVCGRRLVVEYTRDGPTNVLSQNDESKCMKEKPVETNTDVQNKVFLTASERASMIRDEIYNKFGISYPRNSSLSYLYPPPTVTTLTNITNALACCPKLYVQVLHLMNKMNLPAPFGPVIHPPPMLDDNVEDEFMMAVESSDESEIASDTETRLKSDGVDTSRKRLRKVSRKLTKRPKFIPPPLPAPVREPSYVTQAPGDVFDVTDTSAQKKISLNLPVSINPAESDSFIAEDDMDVTEDTQEIGEFGKIEPIQAADEGSESESESDPIIDSSNFISLADIKHNRLSTKQMKDFSCFKSYTRGESSSRIYVKNLARKSTEKELINVFGGFINYQNEEERKMFYVQLMEGRMKGQAFVTMTNESCASEAVREVNGYVLNGKPMVVQFARSSKPKTETTDRKKS